MNGMPKMHVDTGMYLIRAMHGAIAESLFSVEGARHPEY